MRGDCGTHRLLVCRDAARDAVLRRSRRCLLLSWVPQRRHRGVQRRRWKGRPL